MNALVASAENVLFVREGTKAFFVTQLNLKILELWWLNNGGLVQEETLNIFHVRLGYQSTSSLGIPEWSLAVLFSNKDLQHRRIGRVRSYGDEWCQLYDGTTFECFLVETLFSTGFFDGTFEQWRVLPNF